jgi:hypothetical protein
MELGSCKISPLFVMSISVHVGRVEELLGLAHYAAFVLPQWHLHRDLYQKKGGLSFISIRQRRKEGMFCALRSAGIEPTPALSGRAGYVSLNLSATAGTIPFKYAAQQKQAFNSGVQTVLGLITQEKPCLGDQHMVVEVQWDFGRPQL